MDIFVYRSRYRYSYSYRYRYLDMYMYINIYISIYIHISIERERELITILNCDVGPERRGRPAGHPAFLQHEAATQPEDHRCSLDWSLYIAMNYNYSNYSNYNYNPLQL